MVASGRTLPCSSEITLAMGSTLPRILWAMARSTLARSTAGRRPHSTCAFLAAATAASTVSADEFGISESWVSRDGLNTGTIGPELSAINDPPM